MATIISERGQLLILCDGCGKQLPDDSLEMCELCLTRKCFTTKGDPIRGEVACKVCGWHFSIHQSELKSVAVCPHCGSEEQYTLPKDRPLHDLV
jgi:predicted RNA-binding Zn-ribbon protein involved in translation (DUF1610 family)